MSAKEEINKFLIEEGFILDEQKNVWRKKFVKNKKNPSDFEVFVSNYHHEIVVKATNDLLTMTDLAIMGCVVERIDDEIDYLETKDYID